MLWISLPFVFKLEGNNNSTYFDGASGRSERDTLKIHRTVLVTTRDSGLGGRHSKSSLEFHWMNKHLAGLRSMNVLSLSNYYKNIRIIEFFTDNEKCHSCYYDLFLIIIQWKVKILWYLYTSLRRLNQESWFNNPSQKGAIW